MILDKDIVDMVNLMSTLDGYALRFGKDACIGQFKQLYPKYGANQKEVDTIVNILYDQVFRWEEHGSY